ncbi:MAG: G-D-S-L family lipolytic protein [Niabella sp.]|nr:MAG: G-D-S-L family lipolytic protein [Niabella sp.]
MIKIKWIITVVLLLALQNTKGQEPFPYWNEVQKFKTLDSTAFPAKNQILFIGSSSFTKWTDVNDYFTGYKIINRGFGGSRLTDLIRYRYDVIFPYAPRQIVMYCGENDFVSDDKPNVETVMERFEALFQFIRSKYPTTPFAYVSMKPSPSRQHLQENFKEANKRIKQFLYKQKNARFIDVYSAMLHKDGRIKQEIFLGDNLHMNAKGYAIWKQVMEPYLLQ